MTGKKSNLATSNNLRQKAEKIALKAGKPTDRSIYAKQMQPLLHELSVHQVELELQNEELRNRQHELDKARARYFNLYDLAPIGYLTVDESGLILEANISVSNLLMVPCSELLNHPFSSHILPDDQDCYYLKRKALQSSRAVQSWDMRMLRSDNTAVWAHLQAIPALNGECWITLDNIEQRKRMEEQLRVTSTYSRTLIEACPDPLVTISPQGKITDLNEATTRITGVARDDMIGTDFSEYFTDPAKAREGYLRVFSESIVHDYPLAIRHLSGSTRDVLYNASVFKDENGDVKGVFAAARDVTERNRILEDLKRSRNELETRVQERTRDLETMHQQMQRVSFELIWAEERERIAGELHDQVGQSLLLAKMKLDALADSLPADSSRCNAEEAGRLIETCIHDIRSLTFRMRPPILDTAGIATALECLCSSISIDYGLQIDFSSDDLPKPVPGEARYAIYQAVRELLLNVVKHSGVNRAGLSLETGERTLGIRVTDSGIGFKQADVCMQHVSNGGYGLFNVQQRILMLGGRFDIRAEPGKGTSIALTIPI